jgi:hypothetical protein
MCEVNREILATLIANAWKMKMESPFAISWYKDVTHLHLFQVSWSHVSSVSFAEWNI